MKSHGQSRFNRGFTLLEMLIVIGVISILVAIVMPVVTGVLNRARTVACTANQRSLLGVYQVQRMTGSGLTAEDDIKAAVSAMKGSVTGAGGTFVVSGVCPGGGAITLACDKHHDSTVSSFPDTIARLIVGKIGSATRHTASGDQTLASYLSTAGKQIDSDSPGSDTQYPTWTETIKGWLQDENQNLLAESWSIRRTNGNYEICVTAGGKLSTADKGKRVNVVLYKYDADGALISSEYGTASVEIPKGHSYSRLVVSTFKAE